MKMQRGIINKTIIAICSLALSFCTGIHAEELRLTNSNGIITINTNDGSVTIDTDDIEDNAQALDALEGQLNNIYFKYESGYYWAKSSADSEWEKIGAVGNTEPWMVLKNTGDKDITFSSQSGVDIAGAMENYAGNKELLVTSDATLSNIGGKKYLSLEVPFTGYYTASDNVLDADTTRINYALAELGDAEAANVLDGKYFTSSAGIRTKGSIKNNGVLNWNPSGIATIAINGFYSGGTISTENAYNTGYNNGRDAGYGTGYDKGKNDALRSINPYRQNTYNMVGKRSFSFSTINGNCYIVNMMLTEWFSTGDCSISGGSLIGSYHNHLSRRNDCWTSNILLIIRANGNSIGITLNGKETPGDGEHGCISEAVVFKCS